MSFISSKRIDNSRKSRFEIAPAISSYVFITIEQPKLIRNIRV